MEVDPLEEYFTLIMLELMMLVITSVLSTNYNYSLLVNFLLLLLFIHY